MENPYYKSLYGFQNFSQQIIFEVLLYTAYATHTHSYNCFIIVDEKIPIKTQFF